MRCNKLWSPRQHQKAPRTPHLLRRRANNIHASSASFHARTSRHRSAHAPSLLTGNLLARRTHPLMPASLHSSGAATLKFWANLAHVNTLSTAKRAVVLSLTAPSLHRPTPFPSISHLTAKRIYAGVGTTAQTGDPDGASQCDSEYFSKKHSV